MARRLHLSALVWEGESLRIYPEFRDALEHGGFKGTITCEMCSPLVGGRSIGNQDRQARKFAAFLGKRRKLSTV